jgi:hypothetical protein
MCEHGPQRDRHEFIVTECDESPKEGAVALEGLGSRYGAQRLFDKRRRRQQDNFGGVGHVVRLRPRRFGISKPLSRSLRNLSMESGLNRTLRPIRIEGSTPRRTSRAKDVGDRRMCLRRSATDHRGSGDRLSDAVSFVVCMTRRDNSKRTRQAIEVSTIVAQLSHNYCCGILMEFVRASVTTVVQLQKSNSSKINLWRAAQGNSVQNWSARPIRTP